MHRLNIVHRDLKLENIIIYPETLHVKIIDFGFSTVLKGDRKLTFSCGTPHYLAPELALKKDYHGKPADMWALGVILYALLTGKLPFSADFETDLYRRISLGKFQIPSFISVAARRVIASLL